MNGGDSIERVSQVIDDHFDASTVILYCNDEAWPWDRRLRSSDDQNESYEILVRLTAAVRDSTLRADFYLYDVERQQSNQDLIAEVTIQNPTYLEGDFAYLSVSEDDTGGSLFVSLDYMVSRLRNDDPSLNYFGARILARIVDQARKLTTIDRLELLAAGGLSTNGALSPNGIPWGGYFVWADYGFDAPLPPTTWDKLSSMSSNKENSFRDCVYVSDLLSIDDGRDLWKKYGDGGLMTFSLSPGSWSMKRLNDVLARRVL
jgi:hypothetical protein